MRECGFSSRITRFHSKKRRSRKKGRSDVEDVELESTHQIESGLLSKFSILFLPSLFNKSEFSVSLSSLLYQKTSEFSPIFTLLSYFSILFIDSPVFFKILSRIVYFKQGFSITLSSSISLISSSIIYSFSVQIFWASIIGMLWLVGGEDPFPNKIYLIFSSLISSSVQFLLLRIDEISLIFFVEEAIFFGEKWLCSESTFLSFLSWG